jgi:hypothetical protein
VTEALLRVSAESALRNQRWVEQAQSLTDLTPPTPRTLAEAGPLAPRWTAKATAEARAPWRQSQREIAAGGAGAQFVIGLLFLKDDILRAMHGYTASPGARD